MSKIGKQPKMNSYPSQECSRSTWLKEERKEEKKEYSLSNEKVVCKERL